jgi:hypothetical protein
MIEWREGDGDSEEVGTVAQEDDAWKRFSKKKLPDTRQN